MSLRQHLVRAASENPELRSKILPLLSVKVANSVKVNDKLNMVVELKVTPISGGWPSREEEEEQLSRGGPGQVMYHAQVVYSATVRVRESMGLWATLYSANNVRGSVFSDPGGGFYIQPKSGHFHKDGGLNMLIGSILGEVVYKNRSKLAVDP